ncbi:MAG: extracellular solute-binding protein [Caldilineaceae bacterium]
MLNPQWMVRVFLFVAVLMSSTAFTACFGSSDAEAPEEVAQDAAPAVVITPTPSPSPTAQTASVARGAIVHTPPPAANEPALIIWVDAPLAPLFQNLAASFEVEYGLKITVIEKGLVQIESELVTADPAKETPDILIGSSINVAPMVDKGLLHEVRLDNRVAEFDPNALQAMRVNGKLYGLSYTAETVALIYNPNMVAKAPTSWSDLRAMSATLKDSGRGEYGLVLQSNEPRQFQPILTAFGGFLFGNGAEGNLDIANVGIDSAGALAAGAWLEDMKQAGLLLSAADVDEMYSAFASGRAAMMIGDAEMAGRLRSAGAAYAVAALPHEVAESQPLLTARALMISAASRDPDLAQTFLTEFMATPENMQAIYAADPRPSAYLPVLDALENNELRFFTSLAENIQIAPTIPAFPAAWAIWTEALNQVIGQGEPAETIFTQAAAQIRAAVETQ